MKKRKKKKINKIIRSLKSLKINLLKISLIVSIIGIFLLLLLSNFLQPKLININQINDNLLDKEVKVQGQVFNSVIHSSNFQVISIRDKTGRIDITINKNTNNLDNKYIEVVGIVKPYKQYLQIQAERIIV